MVWLGDDILFLKELKRPCEHTFNLFRHTHSFKQNDESTPRKRPLTLSLFYGDNVEQNDLKRAWYDLPMLECAEGIGVEGWRLARNTSGDYELSCDGESLCDVYLEFKRRTSNRLCSKTSVHKGEKRISLPSNVSKLLDAGKTIVMEMSPYDDLTDEPQREYTTRFTLRK